jgi:hypothetical protein
MATYNSIERSKEYTPLSCDGCGSTNIQETVQGYVCGECGLVLEITHLQYYRPYNEDVLQYAKLNTTQIGTKRERFSSPHARKLKSLHRLHCMRNHKQVVFAKARVEINRILGALDLPLSFQESIFVNFKRMYSNFKPNTKYRSVEKLIPVIVYYILRDHKVTVHLHQLLEISKISKAEFNHFRMQVGQYKKNRNSLQRQLFISQKLLEIKEHFNFGMGFVFYAKKIMNRLWNLINNTTDNVIAGVSASITILCYYKDQVSINAICNLLGIRMSTIQFQVKHRLFEQLKVEGFNTLKKSTDILKTIMNRLGLFESEATEVQADVMVKVELGTASQIFNHELDVVHYLLGVLTTNKEKLILGLKIYRPSQELNAAVSIEGHFPMLFELDLCKYSHGKDPPISSITRLLSSHFFF